MASSNSKKLMHQRELFDPYLWNVKRWIWVKWNHPSYFFLSESLTLHNSWFCLSLCVDLIPRGRQLLDSAGLPIILDQSLWPREWDTLNLVGFGSSVHRMALGPKGTWLPTRSTCLEGKRMCSSKEVGMIYRQKKIRSVSRIVVEAKESISKTNSVFI